MWPVGTTREQAPPAWDWFFGPPQDPISGLSDDGVTFLSPHALTNTRPSKWAPPISPGHRAPLSPAHAVRLRAPVAAIGRTARPVAADRPVRLEPLWRAGLHRAGDRHAAAAQHRSPVRRADAGVLRGAARRAAHCAASRCAYLPQVSMGSRVRRLGWAALRPQFHTA